MRQPTITMPADPRAATEQTVEPQTFKSLYKDYLSLTKPGITMSNLMTTFAGLWLGAGGRPNILLAVITLIGSSLVVMSGCTLNNYMDRDIDHLMARTQNRPMPNARLRPWTVLVFGLVLGALGLGLLGAFVNMISAVMALIGLFFYVIVYTGMTKRTTTLSTVIGGVSGAMPPLIGWTAMTGSLDTTGWVLFSILFMWQPPHFLALAMRRVKDYGAAGIPLLPVVYGFGPTKRQIIVWTAGLVPVTLMLYGLHAVNIVYLIGAVILGVIYLYKAMRGITTKDDTAWATDMFKYSLIYLTVLCVLMIVGVQAA